jgi:hypothetical protein
MVDPVEVTFGGCLEEVRKHIFEREGVKGEEVEESG